MFIPTALQMCITNVMSLNIKVKGLNQLTTFENCQQHAVVTGVTNAASIYRSVKMLR